MAMRPNVVGIKKAAALRHAAKGETTQEIAKALKLPAVVIANWLQKATIKKTRLLKKLHVTRKPKAPKEQAPSGLHSRTFATPRTEKSFRVRFSVPEKVVEQMDLMKEAADLVFFLRLTKSPVIPSKEQLHEALVAKKAVQARYA